MKRKPVVGETLYSLNVGNLARNKQQVLTPVVVSKVGRKYFEAGKGYAAIKYRIEDWIQHTEYCINSCLYENEQDWLDEKEKNNIWIKCRTVFSSYGPRGLSLDKLKRIEAIMEAK